ncbi:MAG TPA: DUF3795 domain-containing protein [Thermotogota bacterium]|jgi:hypothetical protein|nr:DUF3795 domain-containing protein [Thermotogota bacterium]NLH20195.1 DUF3795 domain-containing protein [Thermotogaceae bacterium]OQC31588.1 MAG: hypothetical protein BWX67_01008 [Thermotogota bacterium ADurb.Bin062]HOD91167.1 DUF3795 domain-containing protein [Thermotogota bacterium]HOF23346.1 DUF3795 domain-containing protein [Thermotogota bacterium]
MIAYCGIYCEECPSYKGTITVDKSLLEKMSEDFGNAKTDTIDFVCLGCKYDNVAFVATYCAGCQIRLCAKEKGFLFDLRRIRNLRESEALPGGTAHHRTIGEMLFCARSINERTAEPFTARQFPDT